MFPEASAQTSLLIPLIFTFTLVIQTVLIPHFQNLRGDRYLTPEEKLEKLVWYLCRGLLLRGSCYAKRLVSAASARVGKRLVLRHRSASTLIIYLVSNIMMPAAGYAYAASRNAIAPQRIYLSCIGCLTRCFSCGVLKKECQIRLKGHSVVWSVQLQKILARRNFAKWRWSSLNWTMIAILAIFFYKENSSIIWYPI